MAFNAQLSHRKPSFSGRIETEIALIIKNDPLENSRRVANLSSILDYDLKRRRSFTIHDTYFDTGSKYFTRNLISFRLRRFGREVVLSVKSSPRRLPGGGVSRLELERPWTYDSLTKISRKLDLEPPSRDAFERSARSPSRVLAAAGLEVIQTRLNRRRVRDLVAFTRGRLLSFAELSIDDVTYTFVEGTVRLLEVEIETRRRGALPKTRRVVNWLLSELPALQLWAHGKFVTGMAIKKLLRNQTLNELTNEGLLIPDAFELTDQTVRAGSL